MINFNENWKKTGNLNEKWVEVNDSDGNYMVSNYGVVKSFFRTQKILRQHPDKDGYLRVTLSLNKKTKRISVHRLVALHFIPNPDNLPQVNHKDFNILNNHVSNLEWMTSEQDREHALEKTLTFYKITPKIARDIYIRFHTTIITDYEIAKEYKISVGIVRSVIYQRKWKRFTKDLTYLYFQKYKVIKPNCPENEEVWVNIPGYNFYEISNFGNVKSFSKSNTIKILSPAILDGGYRQVCLQQNAVKKWHRIYVLVAQAFILNPFKFKAVHHIDNNHSNDNAFNLQWCDNTFIAREKYVSGQGKVRRGETNNQTKVTEKDILDMRNSYNGKDIGFGTLAKKYNLHKDTVKSIIKRENWVHI